MKIYIVVVFLLSSGAVSGGSKKVLKLAEFIVDIYQHFPHSCVFLLNSEAQQQGENEFYIIDISCLFSLEKTPLIPVKKGSAYPLRRLTRKCICNYIISMIEK